MSEAVHDLIRVLDSIEDPEFARVVDAARELLRTSEPRILANETALSAESLRDIYRVRKQISDRSPHANSGELEKLLCVLERSVGEKWHIFSIEDGPEHDIAVFATDTGVGRVCVRLKILNPSYTRSR